jgi:glycosyltransferase involved in cell wall biosynthesis
LEKHLVYPESHLPGSGENRLMKKVCIDARLWGIDHTGIGRYTENLIAHLPETSDISVSLIVAPENASQPKLAKFKKFIARHHPYSIASQFEMLKLWFQIRPNLIHFTHSSISVLWPGKMVVTFHDLIRHISRGPDTTTRNYTFFRLKYLGYLLVDRIAMLRAGKIIVPAMYWKKELVNRFHIPENKITVTYEGVDPEITRISEKKNFGMVKPFVVYTGNIYPHKNIPVLLNAIKLLKGQVGLALVGARSVFTERAREIINRMQVAEYVHLLGRLTDKELSQLYSRASAFVFPSLIEGFGLTGLEAMAAGLPVIAADASCLPEIYGKAAVYFDPKNPEDLSEKIFRVVSDSRLNKTLSALGLEKVKQYSWSKMASETWNIYQNALL